MPLCQTNRQRRATRKLEALYSLCSESHSLIVRHALAGTRHFSQRELPPCHPPVQPAKTCAVPARRSHAPARCVPAPSHSHDRATRACAPVVAETLPLCLRWSLQPTGRRPAIRQSASSTAPIKRRRPQLLDTNRSRHCSQKRRAPCIRTAPISPPQRRQIVRRSQSSGPWCKARRPTLDHQCTRLWYLPSG